MVLIRPRLTDHFNLPLAQEEVDFAIPYLDEDIPLCVDPFLLWKSPSQQDNALHTVIVNSFNGIGQLHRKGKTDEAADILIQASECEEVGLGFSGTRRGHRIGRESAKAILSLFDDVPQLSAGGFTHFEETQLLVDNFSKDRVSDLASNFVMSFLIDFSIEQCERHGIPLTDTTVPNVFDYRTMKFSGAEKVKLPVNPITQKPLLLVPKRWLRAIPWITFDDYISNYYEKEILTAGAAPPSRIAILNFNRHNYDSVQLYVKERERVQTDCKNDPLFRALPLLSVARKFKTLKKLPTGKTGNADKHYEDLMCQILASMLYPQLDFAAEQSRTDSGVLIRDLIFYNSRSMDFLQDIYRDYDSRQIVMELKNVAAVERDHINQLNRYLADSFGRFGILLTRNRLSSQRFKNTIDLWAGQRRCIIVLTDEDIEQMVTVFETKQRLPIEIVKAKYIEFARSCPS
jgi:hypothetical protein